MKQMRLSGEGTEARGGKQEEGALGASAVLCPCSSVQSVSLPGSGPEKMVLTFAPAVVLVWNWALTGQSPLRSPAGHWPLVSQLCSPGQLCSGSSSLHSQALCTSPDIFVSSFL